MGLARIADLADAEQDGRRRLATVRKVPSNLSTAGRWVDLSMAPGQPVPNYYASSPLVASTLEAFRGIYHGDDVEGDGSELYLTAMQLCSPTAGFVGQFMLLDYLLYYPFVDLGDTDTQVMDNTTTLPRYVDGDGVMAMLVAVTPTTGGGIFTFDYYNQDGVLRTSPTHTLLTATAISISEIATSPQANAGSALFLRLADGDTGIRSIVSWTNSFGDLGLAALVLVKPLVHHQIREINTPAEIELVRERAGCPRIYDGAFLGLVVNCAATVAAGTLTGVLEYIWKAT